MQETDTVGRGRPRIEDGVHPEFNAWLKTRKVADVAEALEVHPDTIYKLRRLQFTPSLALALAIEELTEGEVTCGSWFED